jgi:Bacterial protein of unknown function (DUF885)
MIGAREIAQLRREAEQTLGPRFDIRAFHSRVLGWGAGPLPMLRESVSRWLRDLGLVRFRPCRTDPEWLLGVTDQLDAHGGLICTGKPSNKTG